MTKLYMAYGSNLNTANMASRCPNAIKLGSMYIPKYKLVFRHVADIVPSYDKEDLLPVGLWEITEDCEKALDFYEGYPNLYGKVKINGIMTYKMNNNNNIMPPSSSYFHTILEVYTDFDLTPNHLYDALGWSHYKSDKHEWSLPKPKRTFKSYRLLTDKDNTNTDPYGY